MRDGRDGLRRSERKVADLVLADPRRILGATVARTADLAGVSQPTVIRFAAALGCAGYQDFQLRLAHSLALGATATHSVLADTDDTPAIVGKIFDLTLASLDRARSHLDLAAVGRAVEMLAAARSITFVGFGASGIVAADAQQKFPAFGVPCVFEADAHQQVMAATMMRPGDVMVAISNTGRTRAVLDAVRVARESGAGVVGLTGTTSALSETADVSIVVETLDNTDVYTPSISRIAALVVIDVLSTAVALRRGEEDRARFQAMKRVLVGQRQST